MSGLDPNGGGPLVSPGGGGGGGTHGSGTLAARPASPNAGDTYAVTSGAQVGARFTCFVDGSWEGSMSFSVGHSWERTSAASAGAGARFLDVDTGVITVSSGDDAIGWYVELGGPNLRDTCVLESTSGYVRTTADLTAFARDSATLAVLFRWDGDTGHPYYFFGSLGTRPRGLIPAIKSAGSNWNLVIYQGSDITLTTMTTFAKASFATGWHALVIAPVLHDFGAGAVGALAWSLDGSAVAYVATAIAYTTPNATDYLVAANDDVVDMPLNGAVAELAAWTSTLTGAQMAALSTVPASPTCKLPITSAMGVPKVWIQASRFDPRQPTVCPVRIGHLTVVATANSVTRREY